MDDELKDGIPAIIEAARGRIGAEVIDVSRTLADSRCETLDRLQMYARLKSFAA